VPPLGQYLLEVGEGQALGVKEIFATAGFARARLWKDLGGIERVVGATQ
jgi:methylase of polypeptide subunit release factors